MTEILREDADGIARAASLLRAGRLVAFVTETVYGLGADATNAGAVAAIYAAKGRPSTNPLICHYPDAESAFAQVRADARAARLAHAFWPGPLTLILPRRADCPVVDAVTAGLDTLGVRVPSDPAALALLRAVNRPVAAPSANPSGQVSPTSAQHVLSRFGNEVAAVLGERTSDVGVESTVLDLTADPPRLLRPGGIPREAIEREIGPVAYHPAVEQAASAGRMRSPGLLASHYAPDLPVRLCADAVASDEALLAFGQPLPGAGAAFNLSPSANLEEAASRLYEGLRRLDADGRRLGLCRIAVMPIPGHGLGLAIRDRLGRAAAPRDGGKRLTQAATPSTSAS
ncbi:MAG: L-threonylcarbamoyladenylate synthase [Acetobacteraceae bacterium]